MSINSRTTTMAATVVLSTSLPSGCAMSQENQQIGGALLGGVAAGVTTGLLTGNVGYGIAAGVAGAALGWGAVKLVQAETKQVRTAEEDQKLYGFAPASDKVLIKLNKGYASPKTITAGEETTIYSDYSLAVPPSYNGQADVTYSWKLKKDGEVLMEAEPITKSKMAAGHQTDQPISIPKEAESGTYIVETRLSSGDAYDVNEAIFVVQ